MNKPDVKEKKSSPQRSPVEALTRIEPPALNNVAYLVFRRLRKPLLVLVCVYSISVLGFVLIPGVDDQGNPYSMTFFDALYFVSFMGSTIGFGEVPYTFNYPQRFWTLFAMYATVISWLYSIGAVFSIFQDDAFQKLLRRNSLRRQVRAVREPFYIVCGYGLAGKKVVHGLVDRGIHCVVIDDNVERIESVELESLAFDVPVLLGDASEHDTLMDAGMTRDNCLGVISLTRDDATNLGIAICCKLIVPERIVISRCISAEYSRNLNSFGTDHVLYAFDVFAEYLDMAIHTPYRYWLHEWLISANHNLDQSVKKPKRGLWILCGFGRFGKAVKAQFDQYDDVSTVIIEPDSSQCVGMIGSATRVIQGLGTEADMLLDAGVMDAVGIIAGTSDDANNLSIIMTAVELKPSLITVSRQNKRTNAPVFAAANIDMMMQPSAVIANQIMALIKSPLLVTFIQQMRHKDEAWAKTLVEMLSDLVGDRTLDSWSIRVSEQETPAIYRLLVKDDYVPLGTLYHFRKSADKKGGCRALLIKRENDILLMPESDFALRIYDEILVVGVINARQSIRWILENDDALKQTLKQQALSVDTASPEIAES